MGRRRVRQGKHETFVVTIGSHSVRVSDEGAGQPLLMLNGLGASLEVLAPLRNTLADFRTIAFDPPGVGGSSELAWPLRLPAHADVAMALLDQLGVEQVDLFGVSWGGALAQEIAYRYPDRVRSLILCSTTPGPALLATIDVYLAFFDTRRRTSAHYVEHVAPTLFGGRVREEARALLDNGIFRHLARKDSRSYLYQMAAAAGWSSLRYLCRLRQRTLIVTGDDDPLVRPYNSRLLAALIPNSRLEIVAGDGHFLIVTSAAELAALVRDFVAEGAIDPAHRDAA